MRQVSHMGLIPLGGAFEVGETLVNRGAYAEQDVYAL